MSTPEDIEYEATRLGTGAPAPADARVASDARAADAAAGGATRTRDAGAAVRTVSHLEPGSVLRDRFVIDRVLGVGGMGVVYRALDRRKEENNDRDPFVALKLLNDEFHTNPMMAMALQREARKAQTLAHPSIVTVYDYDRDGERAFVTMELLQGTPLDEVIREHPKGITRTRALPVVRGMSLGLAYAHNKKIVHSDFKPGNVFVTDGDRPRILDFGIARAAPATSETALPVQASDVTRFDAGQLGALTPSYASLEMWERREPHPADDVYALAIVTYEMLAGHHPFDNEPAPRAMARKMVPKPIPGLKRREWHALRHGLAFERDKRTANAAEFLREFEGAGRLRLFLIATALALAVVAGFAVWREVQTMQAERPAVAFETLPEQTRTAFTTYMQEGAQLERFGDAGAALDRYTRAYRLHPRNTDAVAAIEDLVTRVTDGAIANANTRDIDVVAENVAALLAIDDFLDKRTALVDARDALIEAREAAP